MASKEENRWNKSEISYQNYQEYISNKTDHFKLTFIDLLYISNFKGGNATINEKETVINQKLIQYSTGFEKIDKRFPGRKLSDLTDGETEGLIFLVEDIVKLTHEEHSRIDGFSASYLSALLNAHFPDLIPILDRRLLINLELVKDSDKDSQEQIKNIKSFYDPLIKRISEKVKESGKSIREVDKVYFSKHIPIKKRKV
jgi:hypothetical protein